MLGIPAETPYDLRFRLLGIPVRVHPFFWLIMAAIGFDEQDVKSDAHLRRCAFVSILVHEFGHGLMSRVFGRRPSIILFGMGGLCTYSDIERAERGHRFLILVCGPWRASARGARGVRGQISCRGYGIHAIVRWRSSTS